MESSLTIENFKMFSNETKIDLSPITIFTGKNNSGKSSFIKPLLLIQDYLMSPNQTILNFWGNNFEKHKIGEYGNAINWDNKSKKHSLRFLYRFSFGMEMIFSGNKSDSFALLDTFRISNDKKKNMYELKRLSVNSFLITIDPELIIGLNNSIIVQTESKKENLFSLEKLEKELKDIKKKKTHTPNQQSLIEIINTEETIKKHIKELKENLLPKQVRFKSKTNDEISVEIDISEYATEFKTITNITRNALQKFISESPKHPIAKRFKTSPELLLTFFQNFNAFFSYRFYHLSPYRIAQQRIYKINEGPTEISPVLNEYSIFSKIKGNTGHEFLKLWLKRMEFGEDVIVNNINGVLNEIKITKGGRQIDLVDMGFGVGQVVVILMLISNKINELSKYKYLCIEEPESNLHPSLQSMLAEVFNDAWEKHKIQFIIETHSEYLIRKTQVILNNTKKLNRFKVYYFDTEKGPYEMKYREDGKFIDEFGPGFFDESRNLAFEIL